MSNTQSTEPSQEHLVRPESYVKNYEHALKEERLALKGGGVFDKALSAAFGWDPMPAYRYNEAIRGVGREVKKSEQYAAENLDLLKAQAIQAINDMESEGRYKYDDGSVPPEKKVFPENRRH